MAKRGSWYFEGYQAHYEVDETGRKRRVLTYTGEYYGIKNGGFLGKLRLLNAAITVLLLALLILIQLFPGVGGTLPWIGAPCMWALVPALFFCVGLVNFLTCGSKWEVRQYYAGYRRMRRSAWWLVILMVFVTAAHVVFLIRWPAYFPGEVYYTLGALACTLLTAALLLLQKKHPAVVVQGPTIR